MLTSSQESHSERSSLKEHYPNILKDHTITNKSNSARSANINNFFPKNGDTIYEDADHESEEQIIGLHPNPPTNGNRAPSQPTTTRPIVIKRKQPIGLPAPVNNINLNEPQLSTQVQPNLKKKESVRVRRMHDLNHNQNLLGSPRAPLPPRDTRGATRQGGSDNVFADSIGSDLKKSNPYTDPLQSLGQSDVGTGTEDRNLKINVYLEGRIELTTNKLTRSTVEAIKEFQRGYFEMQTTRENNRFSAQQILYQNFDSQYDKSKLIPEQDKRMEKLSDLLQQNIDLTGKFIEVNSKGSPMLRTAETGFFGTGTSKQT